jgi:hypothetical protein
LTPRAAYFSYQFDCRDTESNPVVQAHRRLPLTQPPPLEPSCRRLRSSPPTSRDVETILTMSSIEYHRLHAFTSASFGTGRFGSGNPAAVFVLDPGVPTPSLQVLQQLATEADLPNTAVITPLPTAEGGKLSPALRRFSLTLLLSQKTPTVPPTRPTTSLVNLVSPSVAMPPSALRKSSSRLIPRLVKSDLRRLSRASLSPKGRTMEGSLSTFRQTMMGSTTSARRMRGGRRRGRRF